MNHSDTDIGCLCLDRGHRRLGKRRWDGLLQVHAEASSNAELSWMDIAQDRKTRTEMEVEFVACVTRRTAKQVRRTGSV